MSSLSRSLKIQFILQRDGPPVTYSLLTCTELLVKLVNKTFSFFLQLLVDFEFDKTLSSFLFSWPWTQKKISPLYWETQVLSVETDGKGRGVLDSLFF